MSLRNIMVPLLLAVVAAPTAGCAVNPVTGGHDLALMSENEEIHAGRENDPKIKKQYGVYGDAELQAYVQDVGRRLAANSHRPGLNYRFTVLDSADVNAFALPGGYVYITRGIMAYLNSEAELAAVLGHEIGHVTARHSVRQYSAAVAANIGATIASIFVPEFGNQAGAQLLNVLGGALLSGYGRDHELEADRLGAQYCARTGYDSQAMIEVVALLKNQEEFEKERAKAEGREPRIYHGVFATHPSADTRLQQVVGEARKYKAAGTNRANRDQYLRHIDGLVFGDSPQEGIRRGNRFYHRDLNFSIAFPQGWRLENSPQSLNARSADSGAVMAVHVEEMKTQTTPRDFMLQRLKLSGLAQEGPLAGARYPSHSAIANTNTPFGKRNARISVLFYNNRAFVFYGTTKSAAEFTNYDGVFKDTAVGLHALARDEQQLAAGRRIRLRRVARGDSFAALAQRSSVPAYAESQLRLINDKYPKGDLVIGEQIKLIEE